jgi:beta-lactamase class D
MSCLLLLLLSSCAQNRIKEHKEWEKYYQAYGITNACMMLRDNNHETIHYYNMERCTQRFTPASTFKIFNSLVGLETGIAPDDEYIIKWDGIVRDRAELNKDMNMREAFKVSNVAYYQELARRIGMTEMQHYLDTVKYGNMRTGGTIDLFWLNDTLQISADEQAGFIKRLYFDELPFSERSQRIVRSMMLHEQGPDYKLYYKTGTSGNIHGKYIRWIVGYAEKIVEMKEPEGSMNKSNKRIYPYFFAQNFEVTDTTKDWMKIRIDILHNILQEMKIASFNSSKLPTTLSPTLYLLISAIQDVG